jgi:hypothetical protein
MKVMTNKSRIEEIEDILKWKGENLEIEKTSIGDYTTEDKLEMNEY